MANRDLTPWRTSGLQSYGRDPFGSFRREMDRLFEDFFAPAEGRSFAPSAQGRTQGMIMPSLDVDESEQAYVVTAELPGIDQKDIELSLDDNVLTLRGEKRFERNEDQGGRRYSERSFGRFERSIPFAAEIDPEGVEASCENGVLKIVLPKNARARDRSRRIEIRDDSSMGGPGMQAGRSAEPDLRSGAGQSGRATSSQARSGQAQADQSPTGQAQAGEGQAGEGGGSQPGMEGGYRPTSDV